MGAALISSSSAAQMPSLLNIFWQDSLTPQITQPEKLKQFETQAWAEIRYENWVDEKGASSITKGDYHHRSLGFLNRFKQGELQLNLLVESFADEQFLSKNEQDWSAHLNHSEQLLDFSFNIEHSFFAMGVFTHQKNNGISLQLKPVQDLKLFYKAFKLNQAWTVSGVFQREDSEDFFAEAKWVTYEYSIPIQTECSLEGGGLSYSGHKGSFYLEHYGKTIEGCELTQANATVPLNQHWTLTGQYYDFSFEPQNSLIQIDQSTQGLNSINGKVSKSAISLDYLSANWLWSLYGMRHQIELQDSGVFNGAALGGLWSSLLVGLGQYSAGLNIKSEQVGIRVKSQAEMGWLTGAELGYAQLKLNESSKYRINAFPFGVLDQSEESSDLTGADMGILGFSVGYQWKNWSVIYVMQQPVPIKIHEDKQVKDAESNSNNSPGSGSDDWQTVFEKWPSANRQTIRFKYTF